MCDVFILWIELFSSKIQIFSKIEILTSSHKKGNCISQENYNALDCCFKSKNYPMPRLKNWNIFFPSALIVHMTVLMSDLKFQSTQL